MACGALSGRWSSSVQAVRNPLRHVYRTRSKPSVGDKARRDVTERCSGSVKLIWWLRTDLHVIFRPFGGDGEWRIVRHPGSVRRTVNLDRNQLITLLGHVADPAHAACQAELTAGATFRLHDGTVSRESVL